MLQLNQIKLPIQHTESELEEKIRKLLRLGKKENFTYEIRKKSIDARKKPELFYVYQIRVCVSEEVEKRMMGRGKGPSVQRAKEIFYRPAVTGDRSLKHSPIVIGAGPAGLFCAFLLTELGFAPIVCERGRKADQRKKDVEKFWETGVLDTVSNVQFGEGGAGTFSDGKLNTGVKDPAGRIRYVLETFVRFGAPADILIDQKPHIGTDILIEVIRNMRTYMESKGCQFCFETRVVDFVIEQGRLKGVRVEELSGTEEGKFTEKLWETELAVLAIGHSARDTFRKIHSLGIEMTAKSFAVGFRVEHPQSMIDERMYGLRERGALAAAPYKVTSNFPNGRGVYSFCMCPGGYVVSAASGKEQTVVNGMSYSGRHGRNANSAIIVSVTPEDFENKGPLAGILYQEALEKRAWELGNGKIIQQLYGDFCANKKSTGFGEFDTETKGMHTFTNLRGLLAADLEQSLMEGMRQFAGKIKGFDRADAILSGIESRTSSPVRILRGESMESSVPGLYPCGEGAGYAGGITSAAMDGLKVAEKIVTIFHQEKKI